MKKGKTGVSAKRNFLLGALSSWGATRAGKKNWHVNLHELVNRRNTKKQPKKNLNTDQGHEGGHIQGVPPVQCVARSWKGVRTVFGVGAVAVFVIVP